MRFFDLAAAWASDAAGNPAKGQKKPGSKAGFFGKSQKSVVIVTVGRRDEAFQTAQQILFAHMIELNFRIIG